MDEQEQVERNAVVSVARSYLGTPYAHEGRVRGRKGGVDCIQFIAAVFERAGIVPPIKIEHYPFDWHLHRDAERYLEGVTRYASEVPEPPYREPLPGDLVLWRYGRAYAHGAIVTEWPMVIHAILHDGCTLCEVDKSPWLNFIGEPHEDTGKPRPRKFFSCWPRKVPA